MSKLLENIFRAVNIALVNELKMVCDRMGIDIWEVIDAASTKPFGFMPFYPGPGPRRPLHPDRPVLPHVEGARVRHAHASSSSSRGASTRSMPYYAVARSRAGAQRPGPSVNGADVLLLGMAYKANVGELRESPSLKLVELLRADGAKVPTTTPTWPTLARQGLASAELDERVLREHDVSVVVTAHDGIDWAMVAREAPLVVDLRNVFPEGDGKVWRL